MLTLHAFGSNGSGQLGIGHFDDVSSPTKCEWDGRQPGAPIRSISAGGNHTLVLYEDGQAFAAGENSDGRIPSPSTSASAVKFRVVSFANEHSTSIERFKLAAATWASSVFVTESGDVFTCGSGFKGELGQGENQESSSKPGRLQYFPPSGARITDIAACMGHVVAVLSNGDVYGWGNGRKGQLGDSAAVVWRPRKIDVPFKVEKATCGRDFSCFAASPSDGRVLVIGSNKHDVISSGVSPIPSWSQIGANWCSVHVLCKDRLTSWGRNDRGQLVGSNVPEIESVACGSEHTLAKTRNGLILAWGWGEHGNCGEKDAETSPNEITRSSGPCFLAAGCATSFIALRT